MLASNQYTTMKEAQPILRWAGSKRKLLPTLIQAVPKTFTRYVEPFAGSAVLFLKLSPASALLNDLNEDLISVYKTIRIHHKAVWKTACGMPTDTDFYYRLRSIDPKTITSAIEKAARFIYLNRFCFNGVYRTNLRGQFNVPRGKGELFIPSYDIFKQFSQRLKTAELYNEDFQTTMERTCKGDFVYLDPPYALGSKRYIGEYGCNSFKEKDEERLIQSLITAHKRGVNILLSYSPSAYIQEKLNNWYIHPITVMRSIAGFASSRRHANEVLISNYNWH